jgi:peptidoglycan/LPS O-acetylase OafA/YrhL
MIQNPTALARAPGVEAPLTPASPAPAGRMLQLDVLRGLAILLVAGRHQVMSLDEAGWIGPYVGRWVRVGWTGVDLFFVLSGFLVSGLLFRELQARGSMDARRFLVRRAFKVWPSYAVYLVYVLAWTTIKAWHAGPLLAARALLPNLLHVQNYLGSPRIHTWSLAVEEHFYLALPLGMHLLYRRARRRGVSAMAAIPYLALAVLLIEPLLRFLVSSAASLERVAGSLPEAHLRFYETHLRIDGLALGVLVAYFHHIHPELLARFARRRLLLVVVGAALVWPMTSVGLEHGPLTASLGLSAVYVGYALILIAVVHTPLGEGPMGRLLGSRLGRAVGFIGLHSYSVYLWHVDLAQTPVKAALARGALRWLRPELQWIVSMGIYVALAVGAGVVLGRLVEAPALAVRDRLFPASSAAKPRAVELT